MSEDQPDASVAGDTPRPPTGMSVTDRHLPSPDQPAASAAVGGTSAPPLGFDPGATVEDSGLVTHTVVKVDAAPALGRSAPVIDGSPLPDRYRLLERLGASTAGQFYAGEDRALERPVSVKILESSRSLDPLRRQRFFHEARIAARLHHPGIAPVFDLDQTPGGDLYFTTAYISEMTLAQALSQAQSGAAPDCISSWRQIVTLLLKVGEALAYAHEHAIVHRDLKPAHIAIGTQGEVQIGGWHWAIDLNAPHGPHAPGVVGTPLYMSPEQARGEVADRRSDVYALGAVLFHALTCEPPIFEADEELFWKLKRAVQLPAPLLQRHADAPHHILQCALEALDPVPAKRPADAAAFVQRLLDALERQLTEDVIRMHERRRARRRLSIGLACTAVLALGAGLFGPPVHAWLTRPPVVLQSSFSDDQMPAGLRVLSGWSPMAESQLSDYAVYDGHLRSKGVYFNYLFFDRMLSGRVQVEFTGRWEGTSPAGEISLIWVPNDPFLAKDPTFGSSYLQVGAWDNAFSSIYINDFGKNWMGSRPNVVDFKLQPDRDYRMRFTIDGALYRIEVDGVTICEYRDPSAPPRNGWVGIYTTRAGKRIDDLVIRSDIGPSLPPISSGETLLRHGHAQEAVLEFERIARSTTGQASHEARYRMGLALRRAGRVEEARSVWKEMREPPWSEVAVSQLLELDFLERRHDDAIAGLNRLYQASPDGRALVIQAWTRLLRWAASPKWTDQEGVFERYLALQTALMPQDLPARRAAAGVLSQLGRHQEVLDRFPDCATEAAQALLALGRDAEVVERYPDRLYEGQRARLNLGHLEEVAGGVYGGSQLLALALTGKPEQVLPQARPSKSLAHPLAAAQLGRWEAIRAFAEEREASTAEALSLLTQDRLEEALAQKPTAWCGIGPSILLRLGRADEAQQLAGSATLMIRQWLAVDALARGDAERARSVRNDLADIRLPTNLEDTGWLTELILLPVADQLAGKEDAFKEAVQRVSTQHPMRWGAMAWHAAKFIDGSIDLARLRGLSVQPVRSALESICRAAHAELAGQRQEALSHWRAYAALPYQQRLWCNLAGDPAVDHFANWRIQVLTATSTP
jgi:serine/threonine protein kinase